jgi:hypothetical protein
VIWITLLTRQALGKISFNILNINARIGGSPRDRGWPDQAVRRWRCIRAEPPHVLVAGLRQFGDTSQSMSN